MSKKELLNELEKLRVLFNSCSDLQKKEEKDYELKLSEYIRKNNLPSDHYPTKEEHEKYLWWNCFSDDYINARKTMDKILTDLPGLMSKITWKDLPLDSWYEILVWLNKEFWVDTNYKIN